jgi:hypothetical protein
MFLKVPGWHNKHFIDISITAPDSFLITASEPIGQGVQNA